MLKRGLVLIGHNIIKFDLPVLALLYGFVPTAEQKIRDTLVMTRLIWTDVDELDYPASRSGKFLATLIGSHSLEAWGHRLGNYKSHNDQWAEWTKEMHAYCIQDVRVEDTLLKHIEKQGYSEQAIELEHRFCSIITLMEQRGFAFNVEAAAALYAKLAARRAQLRAELQLSFPPDQEEMKVADHWLGPDGQRFATKKDAKLSKVPEKLLVRGPNRIKLHEFNPSSRVQVADRLKRLGWKPARFTDSGQPKIDDEVLEEASRTYPAAKPLAEFFLLEKRIGQLAEGDKAWLKLERNGRIHCEVNTNGAVTGRCGHSNPNIAQVPRVGSPYGEECRALFRPSPGFVLVGADASGLELRCLAHYLARDGGDGGKYAAIVVDGDVHTANQETFGLPPGKPGRNRAKTGIYGRIYGAGDEKLGFSLEQLDEVHETAAQKLTIPWWVIRRWAKELHLVPETWSGRPNDKLTAKVMAEMPPERVANTRRGMYARQRIEDRIEGYKTLIDLVIRTVKGRGYLRGLDGRRLRIRSEHAALNTLLQSAGALLVKMATVIWYDILTKEHGLLWGKDFALVAHVHDEIQAESLPEHADLVGRAFVEAIGRAQKLWSFMCPLTGEYKVGDSWAATH